MNNHLRGKRPFGGSSDFPSKRTNADFSDLPTHVPNSAPPLQLGLGAPQPLVAATLREAPPKEPIFIEGTTISLQTEEDIANWIAERKKNWPTRKNVEAKQEKMAAAPAAEKPQKQAVCKFFARNKKCKFGAKCKNVHEAATGSSTQGLRRINGIDVVIPQRYSGSVSERTSLFTKLVQRDLYEHENNVVIDFLRYLELQGLVDQNESID